MNAAQKFSAPVLEIVESPPSDRQEWEAAIRDPARLAELHRTGLLDTAPEQAFDRLTRLVTRLLDTPIGVVSLVDDRRQFFKSVVGLLSSGTPLSHSFCKHVVARRAPLIIEDARLDPLVRDNPVIEAAGVIAYLGIPLLTPDGSAIGSLCAIDHVPRPWSAEDVRLLEELAEVTMSEIALRLARKEEENYLEALRESERFARSTVDALSAHICILDERGVIIAVNRAWREFAEANPPLSTNYGPGADYLAVCDRAKGDGLAAAMAAGIRQVLAGEAAEFSLEYPCHAPGVRRWFIGRVTTFAGAGPRRVVIAHENITARKLAEDAARAAGEKLAEVSRAAGMAEVATSVLHNVGNVLNSVNVSAHLVSDQMRKSPVADLSRVVTLLHEQGDQLGAFFSGDPRGPKVTAFLSQLAETFARERDTQLTEVAGLQKNIEHIKGIVAAQQSYAKVSGLQDHISPGELIEDAVRMNAASFENHEVALVREIPTDLPPVFVDKHKVLQILINLLRNAKHACDDAGRAEKRITVRATHESGRVLVTVTDTGTGIPRENLDRIFNHGFTTKKEGHGFGLHSAANAAKEMGGRLSVHSDGAGCGAAFTLELPIAPTI